MRPEHASVSLCTYHEIWRGKETRERERVGIGRWVWDQRKGQRGRFWKEKRRTKASLNAATATRRFGGGGGSGKVQGGGEEKISRRKKP